MNMPEAIAFCALIIGLIAGAGILLEAYNRKLRSREKEMELRVRLAEAEGRQRVAGMPQIEERLRVLERIATENPSDLTAQIEQLRDLDLIDGRADNKELSA
jgi:hypothetical protein